MKIGILGQGVAGIFLAIMVKTNNILDDVTVIDKNMNAGRKFSATGNGRGNVANLDLNDHSYNCAEALEIVKEFDAKKVEEFLLSIGLFTRELGNLVYPFSLSGKTFVEFLINIAKEKKVKFINNESLLDYSIDNNKVKVQTSKKNFVFDKFIIAAGSPSGPHLGGSQSILSILDKHGYQIQPFKAGLAPIKVNEITRTIENERVKAKVTLVIDKEKCYEEEGEVLFKKDGLSGIAIFNCASVIARHTKIKKATISLDLMPDLSYEELVNKLAKLNSFSKNSVLLGIFTKPICEYIRKVSGVKNLNAYTNTEIKKLAVAIKNLNFTYLDTYAFRESQASIGGVEFNNLNKNLESKTEPNVYFAGEILDADGLCGGYNINFAIASAYRIYNSIK